MVMGWTAALTQHTRTLPLKSLPLGKQSRQSCRAQGDLPHHSRHERACRSDERGLRDFSPVWCAGTVTSRWPSRRQSGPNRWD
jgi:hypothetical protein